MLAAEHHVEELDEPYWHDIEALLGDGGIIERNFDRLTREKLREAGHYASLSTPPDNAERVCLHFIQDVERIYSIYIVGVSLIYERHSDRLTSIGVHSLHLERSAPWQTFS